MVVTRFLFLLDPKGLVLSPNRNEAFQTKAEGSAILKGCRMVSG